MKILILNGSPRQQGNTKKMIAAFVEAAARHSVDVIDVCKLNIKGCLACEYCHTKSSGVCVQKDDMQKIYDLLSEADMLIIASPIYYHGISGQLKCVIDRFYSAAYPNKPKNLKKVAMLLSSGDADMYDGAKFSYDGDFVGYLGLESICSMSKRILNITAVINDILGGQSKRQIFSKKNDRLGVLTFKINRLAALYGTAQEKYEKEQLAKKQLISNLSHDVRTPLVSVIGYLEAIVQNRIPENQKPNYIDTAYEKAIFLKEQINQLFEFVQSDANEIVLSMENTDACEITRQVLIDFLPIIESEHIELNSIIPDEEMSVLVDKESFARIIQNLIKNTLTHGSEGKYLGVFIARDGGSVCIDIADKGQGIDTEHLPYVFERLYKADNARSRGGGIGLAIAKELANKMSGNIEILRSIPGDTVFRITFPEAK